MQTDYARRRGWHLKFLCPRASFSAIPLVNFQARETVLGLANTTMTDFGGVLRRPVLYNAEIDTLSFEDCSDVYRFITLNNDYTEANRVYRIRPGLEQHAVVRLSILKNGFPRYPRLLLRIGTLKKLFIICCPSKKAKIEMRLRKTVDSMSRAALRGMGLSGDLVSNGGTAAPDTLFKGPEVCCLSIEALEGISA